MELTLIEEWLIKFCLQLIAVIFHSMNLSPIIVHMFSMLELNTKVAYC